MSVQPMRLECFGPFSLFENVSLSCAHTCAHATGKGIYLWTLPFDGMHRVNYVGKTSNRAGFSQRFKQELHFAKRGKWDRGKEIRAPLVDCDRWFRGERVVTNRRPSAEESAAAWPEDERMYRALHVFLIPIDGDDLLRARAESTVARHLWDNCEACRRLMCTPCLRRPKLDSLRLSLEFLLPQNIDICGLQEAIQE